jgi:uncharacterized membrane protein
MEAGDNISESKVVLVPGVGSSYGNGWGKLWKYFLELFLIIIIYAVVSSPSWSLEQTTDGINAGDVFLSIIFLAYGLLIVGPIGYGVAFSYLKAARGDKLEIKDIFEAFRNYWNAVLANLLVGAITVFGLVLLIIPGIIFACKLAFTPYLVVDRKMEVTEAVRESWRLTDGHSWKVFLIGLLGIPICIAGLICFGVGVIPAIMWISLALASLYHAVSLTGKLSTQGTA